MAFKPVFTEQHVTIGQVDERGKAFNTSVTSLFFKVTTYYVYLIYGLVAVSHYIPKIILLDNEFTT